MKLAIKELLYSKGRFIMIGLIIVLISWLVFILSGLGTGLSKLSTGVLSETEYAGMVLEEGAEFSLSKSSVNRSLAEEISEQDGVTDTAPINLFRNSMRREGTADSDAKITDIVLIGVEPDSFMHPEIVEGDDWESSEDNQMIADASLKNEGYALGDTIVLDDIDKEFTITGFTEDQTLYHQSSLFLPMDDFQDLRPSQGDAEDEAETVSGIIVQGNDVDLDTFLEGETDVEFGTKEETINAIPGYVAENATIMMMLWFLMIISAFILGVFFYVLTNQKTNQFGVLKAIGGSNGFIIRSVISQVFILSLVSVLVGIGLTYLTVIFLPEAMPFHLEVSMVVIYSLVLLAISVLSSLFSVVKITRIDPLTALGRGE
ncbi:ABC transporter permease [Alkalibacterium kapii]|uniref:Putative hemin transport system permease protein HrtB n=1 Tax=Alkalibacterium kapii TaxID=426704 RepID=A0A511B2K9_9LACT|nr:ABC transporter permease [Alkalibacterium kapii]GEK92047.1 ABC transporter permease [Alkalibacterium kapii]